HHAVVVMGNPPRSGVDVQILVEFALLGLAAEFRITITAAKRPVAAAGPAVVFPYRHLIAPLARLVRGGPPGNAGAQYENGGSPRGALQIDRTFVRRFGCE